MPSPPHHATSGGVPELRPTGDDPIARFRAACLDLAWSLWTELGAPGVFRRHQTVVVDPEPLLLWTPSIAGPDPRLGELVVAWAAAHGDWCSWTRIQGLRRSFPASTWFAFETARLPFAGGAPRPPRDSAIRSPPGRATSRSAPPLPMDRPSLLRFRMRALCGVGARADVLCELLARHDTWMSASDLGAIGYAKRSTGRILADLSAAAIVNSRTRENTIRVQLRSPSALGEIVGPTGRFLAWTLLFPVLAQLLDLIERFDAHAEPVRRVEAHKVREAVSAACTELWLPPPPRTRGRLDAWDSLLSWSAATAETIARGEMPDRPVG